MGTSRLALGVSGGSAGFEQRPLGVDVRRVPSKEGEMEARGTVGFGESKEESLQRAEGKNEVLRVHEDSMIKLQPAPELPDAKQASLIDRGWKLENQPVSRRAGRATKSEVIFDEHPPEASFDQIHKDMDEFMAQFGRVAWAQDAKTGEFREDPIAAELRERFKKKAKKIQSGDSFQPAKRTPKIIPSETDKMRPAVVPHKALRQKTFARVQKGELSDDPEEKLNEDVSEFGSDYDGGLLKNAQTLLKNVNEDMFSSDAKTAGEIIKGLFGSGPSVELPQGVCLGRERAGLSCTGFRPVCQTSVKYRICAVHVTVTVSPPP